MKKISAKERGWLRFLLLTVNPLFSEMWRRWDVMQLDANVETVQLETIQTKDGGTNFRIVANPEYWRKCSDYTKAFIVCHEMCHVLFGHFIVHPKLDKDWVNIAQDIEVNEYLTSTHFTKDPGVEIATVNSVFKHRASEIHSRKGYMYYYSLLMQCLR